MSSSYDVGTRAWQPDTTEGWVASEVVKKTVDGDKVVLEFKLENEEVTDAPRAHGGTNNIQAAVAPYPDAIVMMC
jgi:myosin heavy subunit